jgi:DNA-binding NarL/FixJ family response regulator
MRIILADDHTIVREGISRVLKEAYPLAEIETVSDAEALLAKVENAQWDVVVTDITMPPGDSGLEAVRKIHDMHPVLPVIIMSMHTPDQYAVRSFKAGARGFLSKDAASLELVNAINTVLSGRKYLSPDVSEILANALFGGDGEVSIENLSNRELEVFRMLARGNTVPAIAQMLTLSTNTISTFRNRIFEKMNFQNNMELIRYAVEHNLID